MRVEPDRADFANAYAAGQAQLVWTRLVADLETPVSGLLKLAHGQSHTFLLESVEGGSARGRYSVIGLRPDIIWRCRGRRAEINRSALTDPDEFSPIDADALASLRALVAESRLVVPDSLPPMASGLFGYMGYDSVRLVEDIPDGNPDPLGVPDAVFLRPTIVAIFDSVTDSISLITPVWPDDEIPPDTAYNLAQERLREATRDFDRPLPHGDAAPAVPAPLPAPRSNITREAYYRLVEQAKDYIRAGDVFQVVPSQRFTVPFALPPFALYRALRRLNPSPFLYFFDMGNFAIVGSSPEILVRLRDGEMTVRPIAGTRPRGGTPDEDENLARDLLADPKERAEHLMLLDLGRNDVARAARIGTVKVTEEMAIERYSHVMHLVSNVTGELAPGLDAIDALMAGFPAGTVSGAPKVRAMEIIEELETLRRGIYAGAVGYISAGGALDTCIALRTAVVMDGQVHVQAGGGVVADSDPATEYEETRNKARAVLRAAEEALRFATRG